MIYSLEFLDSCSSTSSCSGLQSSKIVQRMKHSFINAECLKMVFSVNYLDAKSRKLDSYLIIFGIFSRTQLAHYTLKKCWKNEDSALREYTFTKLKDQIVIT